MDKFRVQYKNIGLTYSRCDATKEELLNHLTTLDIALDEYYIVQETHADGGLHLHAWISLSKKPNIRSARFFDYGKYHPNVKKAKRNWVYNYLKKQDKNPVTNIASTYIELAIEGKTQEAIDTFRQQHPRDYIVNMERVNANIEALSRRPPPQNIKPFTGDGPPVDWNASTHTLLVIGAPGIGKTEWAKSYVTSLGETFLRVTHIDDLKRYRGHNFIIYDDCDFKHLPIPTQIHIAEVANDRSIHVRYGCARLPPGVKQIVLANEYPFSEHGAISRRVLLAPQIRFY